MIQYLSTVQQTRVNLSLSVRKGAPLHNLSPSRNLETACFTAGIFTPKFQYEDFRMFGCQSEDRFLFSLNKNVTSPV